MAPKKTPKRENSDMEPKKTSKRKNSDIEPSAESLIPLEEEAPDFPRGTCNLYLYIRFCFTKSSAREHNDQVIWFYAYTYHLFKESKGFLLQ